MHVTAVGADFSRPSEHSRLSSLCQQEIGHGR
jgi:hypothetical protein